VCARRLQEDIGEDDWVNSEEQMFWHGAKLAFTDVKIYILVSADCQTTNKARGVRD
jgi:hypothetical protein